MTDEMKTMETAVETKEAEVPVLILPGEDVTPMDEMLAEAADKPETIKEVDIEDKIQLTDAEKRRLKILRQRLTSAIPTTSCSTAQTRRRRLRSSPTWHLKK